MIRAQPGRQGLVVTRHRADKHASPAAAQRPVRDAGVLQRLLCQFQGQPLLRVHRRGFLRRDTKELCVELIDAGQKTTALAVPVPSTGCLVLAVSRTFGDSAAPCRKDCQNASGPAA